MTILAMRDTINNMKPPERESLKETEEALNSMMVRLEAILAAPVLTSDTLVEITAILNNVSYVFLYLEANEDHINYDRLLPLRDAFYQNADLDQRILKRLGAFASTDLAVERAKFAYIRQLTEKLDSPAVQDDIKLQELKAIAKENEAELAAERAEFIARLGHKGDARKASATLFRLASRLPNSELRVKLMSSWDALAEARAPKMADTIDRMIAFRHQSAQRRGKDTPLSLTLAKCSVTEETIDRFLQRYLSIALAGQGMLEDNLVKKYDDKKSPFSHFSHYMRSVFGNVPVPLFDLDCCLNYAFAVGEAVFGLDFVVHSDRTAPVIVADVSRNGSPIGRINFDLWAQNGRSLGANHTLGLRNRADWGTIVQRPEAYVSCRFILSGESNRQVTFQNVHSLFHEFGHAINHLLIREHIPNQSGLEYLPLERLEYLSMWYEKWVYHDSFADYLDLHETHRLGLALCQTTKKIEYCSTFAERAVTALVDFECHRRRGATLREVYERLDQAHGIGRYVGLSDIAQYFTWPMFMANPGANFSYLWGAAWSVEKFLPLVPRKLEQLTEVVTPEAFDECFEVSLAGQAPKLDAMLAFYWEPQ